MFCLRGSSAFVGSMFELATVGQLLGPGSLELASPLGVLFCPWLAELCDLVGATIGWFACHCWLLWVFRKLGKRNFGGSPPAAPTGLSWVAEPWRWRW